MLPVRSVPFLLALLLSVAVSSAGLPAGSRSRAARMEQWRTKIAEAERAASRDLDAEAERLYREVLDQSDESGDGGMLVARAVDGLGDLCRRQERLEEAQDLYRRAAAMWERLLGPGQPRLAVTLHNLGVVETARGELDAAERHLGRALAIWEESYGAGSEQAENTRRALRLARREPGEANESPVDRTPRGASTNGG